MTAGTANRADPGWLSLRGPADARARTTCTAHLTTRLAGHLERRLPDGTEPVRLIDVGAGAGAGARWLRERIPRAQDWRLVDRDADLLTTALPEPSEWARAVVADVAELPRLLADEPAHVVTCQALLDVLTAEEVDSLLAPAVDSDAAVLLGLSVPGQVTLTPTHPDDAVVAEAFDAHQGRAGRLGPRGGYYAVQALRRHGYAVSVASTPWHLGPADRALQLAWLDGRADAAAEQAPGLSERIGHWRESRATAARRGGLRAVVGHVDVLGLPPAPRPQYCAESWHRAI